MQHFLSSLVLDVRDNKLMGDEDIEKIPSESRRELSDIIVKQKQLGIKNPRI